MTPLALPNHPLAHGAIRNSHTRTQHCDQPKRSLVAEVCCRVDGQAHEDISYTVDGREGVDGLPVSG